MSEKRFKSGDNLSCVDTGTGKSYYYPCNLVGLLNEQQSTITKLKELNGDKGKRIISLIRTNKTLKKENEQLKQILKDIVEVTDETYTKNTSICKVIAVFDYKKYLKIKECLNE